MQNSRPALCPLLRTWARTRSVRRSIHRPYHASTVPFTVPDTYRPNPRWRSHVSWCPRKSSIWQIGQRLTIQTRPITRLQQELNHRTWSARSFEQEETPRLYTRLRSLAISEDAFEQCRELAVYLIRERHQSPNLQLYNALIMSNVCHKHGSAWRIHDLLREMAAEELQPDIGTCHAILEVLAVHPDHLLRVDVLEYMKSRWFQISDDGKHLVTAGLFREGLYEQALLNLTEMIQQNLNIENWLLDVAVQYLCAAGELTAAYRLIKDIQQKKTTNISRVTWYTFLDGASSTRHCDATRMVWKYRVHTGYLNPPAGVCLNALMTASSAGDIELATDIFTHIAKRRMVYDPIHYELMITAYLTNQNADIIRAISLLPIMTEERLEPSTPETRTLYAWLRKHPDRIDDALARLRELQAAGQKIPIAALNLLIECYVDQDQLEKAMRLYKTIHTFVHIGEGAKPSFANTDTVNLLLKGCRRSDPPNEDLASFLISEMIALRIPPTPLTYDRLILVLVRAAASCSDDDGQALRRHELLGWAYRHFCEMQPNKWLPRRGTISQLTLALAEQNDDRCWDVLQIAEDNGDRIENWDAHSTWLREKVETVWRSKNEGQFAAQKSEILVDPQITQAT